MLELITKTQVVSINDDPQMNMNMISVGNISIAKVKLLNH